MLHFHCTVEVTTSHSYLLPIIFPKPYSNKKNTQKTIVGRFTFVYIQSCGLATSQY